MPRILQYESLDYKQAVEWFVSFDSFDLNKRQEHTRERHLLGNRTDYLFEIMRGVGAMHWVVNDQAMNLLCFEMLLIVF